MLTVMRESGELQKALLSLKRQGKKIGLVPTMGNLHAGHLSLIRRVQEESDIVVVSIFVNPTQFGPNEDYAAYPRTFDADVKNIESVVTKDTYIFCPIPNAMYADDFSTWVEETVLSKGLCGRTRPIHFRGVATVVAKLFNITQADVAVFGQKDAQQALVIQRMVRDLNFPIHIIVAPIVRESDGLAMSSRNKYLSPEQREVTPGIYKALRAAEQKVREHRETAPEIIVGDIQHALNAIGGDIDYVEVLDATTLTPATHFNTRVLIAIACKFGTTRLIDNILIEVK